MSNPYCDPADFGLETIGEIDWSDGNYVFDLTVVWRRLSDGVFVYANDAGCSCPSPFEDTGVEDIEPTGSLEAFKAHLLERQAGAYDGDRSAEIAELLERMHAAGAR